MAGKRRATYDLNRDNCEEELPKEEAGNWKPAAQEALKDRPILKARRSLANTSQSPASSPFSGLSFGFGPPKTASTGNLLSTTVPNFSFTSSPIPNNGTSTPVAPTTPTTTIATTSENGKVTTPASIEQPKQASKEEPNIDKSKESRLKEIESRRQSLLAEKQRIESELQKLDLEEKQLKGSGKLDNPNEEKSGDAKAQQLPDDDDIELPPEEPWN